MGRPVFNQNVGSPRDNRFQVQVSALISVTMSAHAKGRAS
jgi:hypothetical protein